MKDVTSRDYALFFVALYCLLSDAFYFSYINKIPWQIVFILGTISAFIIIFNENKIDFTVLILSIIILVLIMLPCEGDSVATPSAYLIVPVIISMKDKDLLKIRSLVIALFLILSLPSVFIQLLHYFKIDQLFVISTVYTGNRTFTVYPGTMVGQEYRFFDITRLAGIYDEPGIVGTISGLLLVSEELRLKKTQNKLLLGLGILSFSLAFYVIIIVNYILKAISLKKIVNWLPMIILIILFYAATKDNFYFKTLIYNRLIVNQGQMEGDNRTAATFKDLFDYLDNQDDYSLLLGNGNGANLKFYVPEVGKESSYMVLIYNHGILTSALLVILLFIIAYKNAIVSKNRYAIWTLFFIFVLSIYQRPFIFRNLWMIIYISGIVYLRDKDE